MVQARTLRAEGTAWEEKNKLSQRAHWWIRVFRTQMGRAQLEPAEEGEPALGACQVLNGGTQVVGSGKVRVS